MASLSLSLSRLPPARPFLLSPPWSESPLTGTSLRGIFVFFGGPLAFALTAASNKGAPHHAVCAAGPR